METHQEKHANVVKMRTHVIYIPADPLNITVGREGKKTAQLMNFDFFFLRVEFLERFAATYEMRLSHREQIYSAEKKKKSNGRQNFNLDLHL